MIVAIVGRCSHSSNGNRCQGSEECKPHVEISSNKSARIAG